MVDIPKAVELADQHFRYDAGAFYGSPNGLSVGVGLIYEGIRFPVFDADARGFDTVEGMVYVLTHECDIDQENRRPFNEQVLVCPIIMFHDFVVDYSATYSEIQLFSFIPEVVADRVFRLFFFPPGVGGLQTGGIAYLNNVSNTHVNEFRQREARPVCALSEYAQGIMDRKLTNHLLRPKEQPLPRYH